MKTQIEVRSDEWMDARLCKPWRNRLCLVHFSDDTYGVCRYNGMYWIGQHDMRLLRADEITHFYIFEKFRGE